MLDPQNVSGRRFLLLGGTGFIGARLAEHLSQLGAQVTVVGRKCPDKMSGSINYVCASIDELPQISALVNRHEVIIYLIKPLNLAASNANILADMQSSVVPFIEILEFCRGATEKFIFLSSGGTVYGAQPISPISESTVPRPEVAYGVSRLTIEHYLHLFHSMHALDFVSLRVANAFGPGQLANQGQGLVATIIDRLLRNKPIEVWGDGEAIRDYVFIDDLVNAIVLATDYNGSEKVMNVGSGIGRSVNDVISDLEAVTGIVGRRYTVSEIFTGVASNVLNVTLVERELGWRATVPWLTGLDRTVDWMKARSVSGPASG